MRLLAPVALHFAFLAALVGGVASSLPWQAKVPLVRAAWRIEGVRRRPFPWGKCPKEANNMSGLAWLGGDRYALVSDKGGNLLWGDIRVDRSSGEVVSAQVLPAVAHVTGGIDMEGCAVAPGGATLVISDEEDTSLARVPLDWGKGGELAPTERRAHVFGDIRPNLSLESLTTAVDRTGFWTINEEALLRDGAHSSVAAGSWVRLLKVDNHFASVRQWAYRTDPAPGSLPVPFLASGVSDLLALSDGQLLVLERGFGMPGFRIRLYLVDPDEDAPDVTDAPHLDAGGTAPLRKKLLYEWNGRCNFEGITMGPELTDGSRSLLLVSDDGDPVSQPGLLALRLYNHQAGK